MWKPLSHITQSSFILLLGVWENVLNLLSTDSKYLQKKDCDILTATSILRSTITAIEEIRTSEYKVFLKTATDLANLLDIPGQFPEFESERKSQCQVKLLKTNS
jgi:hypothetical protein